MEIKHLFGLSVYTDDYLVWYLLESVHKSSNNKAWIRICCSFLLTERKLYTRAIQPFICKNAEFNLETMW